MIQAAPAVPRGITDTDAIIRARAYCTFSKRHITCTGLIWHQNTTVARISATSTSMYEPTQHSADTYGVYILPQYIAQYTTINRSIQIALCLLTKKIHQLITTTMRKHNSPTQTYFPTWTWCNKIATIINK
jgi:hypothetical protein